MALLATQLNDLVATTLRELNKPKFTDLTTDLNYFTALKKLMVKDKAVTVPSGYGIQWDVMVSTSTQTRAVGLGESDVVDITDHMIQGQADWKRVTTNYSFLQEEIDMNREKARIVNLVSMRRYGCMVDLHKKMEDYFWGVPVAITDETTPWGINTWIVKSASEGFVGGAPSGYTVIGNINPTTYARWKNYAFPYTSVTPDDFVRKLRKAAEFTRFLPPVDPPPTTTRSQKWGMYTNYAVVGSLEEILTAQNENLGSDIASMDGKTMFRRMDVERVPRLEADTTNPIFGICWGDFAAYFLEGWKMRQTSVDPYPGQHTMQTQFLDYMFQFVATNRRSHFVGSTGTSYPG